MYLLTVCMDAHYIFDWYEVVVPCKYFVYAAVADLNMMSLWMWTSEEH